jgi:alpha-tubulin suppressor-like RCC1 family protein
MRQAVARALLCPPAMNRTSWCALAAVGALFGGACGDEMGSADTDAGGDGLGVVELAISTPPAAVKCLTLSVVGPDYSKLITTPPVASFTVTGMPLNGGFVYISGLAYEASCDALTNVSPTWAAQSGQIEYQVGTVGHATLTFRRAPTIGGAVDFEEAVAELSLGKTQAFAIMADGSQRAWGLNNAGQLGDNSKTAHLVPTVVDVLKGFIPAPGIVVADVSSRSTVSCALVTAPGGGGAVRCWGNNDNGQVGDGTTVTRLEPVTLNSLSPSARGVTTGGSHACAIVSTGAALKALCWGRNDEGQLGLGNTVGKNIPTELPAFASGANLAQIAAGQAHTCVRYGSGQVECWGRNLAGQLGNGTNAAKNAPTGVSISNLAGITKLSVGDNHACALRTDGTLFCWGQNDQGQVGLAGGSGIVSTPVAVLSNIIDVAAGINHTCAVTEQHKVFCWGAAGTLGNNSANASSAPVQVPFLGDVVAVAAGSATCAIHENGAASCWGPNSEGLLGTGDLVWRFVPTALGF